MCFGLGSGQSNSLILQYKVLDIACIFSLEWRFWHDNGVSKKAVVRCHDKAILRAWLLRNVAQPTQGC